MRLLLLADVHADITGLREVLDDAAQYGWDQAVLLGDLVGYGSEPLETLRVLAGLDTRTSILGNHELMLADLRAHREVAASTVVLDSLRLCLERLPREQLDALEQLPVSHTDVSWQAVHGSLKRRFNYVISPADARLNEPEMTRDVVFCGHSHVPIAFVSDRPGSWRQRSALLPETHIGLGPGERAIINPGSASHNRDRQAGRSYGIYDEQARTLLLRRMTRVRARQVL